MNIDIFVFWGGYFFIWNQTSQCWWIKNILKCFGSDFSGAEEFGAVAQMDDRAVDRLSDRWADQPPQKILILENQLFVFIIC